jgi:hypothetical protein
MMGNISPLFIGFLPFVFLTYRAYPVVKSTYVAGIAGLVSLTTWLLLEPLILTTRYVLLPLALFTIPLSAAFVALEHELCYARASRWLVQSAIFMMIGLFLFQSRGVVYAVRYIAAIDHRDSRYISKRDFDVATWLNTHVQPGQRVALNDYRSYPYFLNVDILLNSESAEEIQWLWERRDRLSLEETWAFYAQQGFTYVVVRKEHMDHALSSRVHAGELSIVFVGQEKMVGRTVTLQH